MQYLTNEKLVIVGAAGMIGSNMAQSALMMGLTTNLCLYDVFSPEGVAEEMRQSGFDDVNITATTLATMAFGIVLIDPTIANISNTIIMTLIVLIFGEIIPKCIAKDSAEKFALLTSGLLYFLIKILTPIVFIFIGIKKIFVRKISNPIIINIIPPINSALSSNLLPNVLPI